MADREILPETRLLTSLDFPCCPSYTKRSSSGKNPVRGTPSKFPSEDDTCSSAKSTSWLLCQSPCSEKRALRLRCCA